MNRLFPKFPSPLNECERHAFVCETKDKTMKFTRRSTDIFINQGLWKLHDLRRIDNDNSLGVKIEKILNDANIEISTVPFRSTAKQNQR